MEEYEARHARETDQISRYVPLTLRRWLYGVTTALIPLLVAYGIIQAETAPLWIGLAVQTFATATAFAHTPSSATRGD